MNLDYKYLWVLSIWNVTFNQLANTYVLPIYINKSSISQYMCVPYINKYM